jgi:hypothetical protein
MILKFPDLATLRLALTSGAVPPAVSAAPVTGGDDVDGSVWVEAAGPLPRASQNELKRLGVQTVRSNGAELAAEVYCWAQLLPLEPDPGPPAVTDQTPVLFEVASGGVLAELITEMLRLGNDRQSFRWLEDGTAARALLRVAGPPYYSLLRAVDRIGREKAPVAFVERAPRVWVELGYAHPLAEHVKPPKGKLLLLRPPRRWTQLDDEPFRDVYEILEFTLPAAPARWSDAPPGQRVRVAPTLAPGGTEDGAELWVLRDGGVDELNRFVQNADDHLLHRLAFAVGEKGGETTVVVRVRQSRQAPPVLVLKGEPYKQYLKLPNLFLPAGARLHPPLRRDVVRRLLADDPDRLTWLTPHPDGSFTPQTLPEDAFRPLADWVEYVLDRDREALQAWVQASQFDFEGFVCPDDQPAKPRKPAEPEQKRGSKGRGGREAEAPQDQSSYATAATQKRSAPEEEPEAPDEPVAAEPAEALKRLKALQERFLAAEGGLDAPERVALWPEMAALYGALGGGGSDDAGVCWMNALWSDDDVPPARARAWFRAEAAAVAARPENGAAGGRSWASRLTLAGAKGRDVTGEELDRLLALEEPDAADVRALAAYLVYAAGRTPPPEALVSRLNRVRVFLEAHERMLPVRAVWLAWAHLTRLAGGDVLALARARDRLLGRLFSNGLRPETDLPTFLRFAGEPGRQRFREVRQWLTQLCERARQWAGRQGHDALYEGNATRTADYLDLLFAFGLARLGEADASRRLLRRATAGLAEKDDAHNTLLEGFQYRIEQALAGKPHGGPLPVHQLEYLEELGRDYVARHEERQYQQNQKLNPRYIVDRMRAVSRILEPDQQIDPYRHFHSKADGELDAELALLPDVLDLKEVVARVRRLLQKPPKGASGPEARAKILRAGLDQSPRVSEEFARELLDQVAPAFDALGKGEDIALTVARANLVEKALFVAAHFDRAEHIPHLVSRFERILEGQRGGATTHPIETLAAQCFRGLRKLGMRDEIDRLLTLMADVVLRGKALASLDERADKPAALRALLHVAGGWYYFGRDDRAEPLLKAARATLFGGELTGRGQEHTNLACAYAATVGQAPVEVARRRLEEVFDKLTGVRDTFTTNVYYSQSQVKLAEAVVLAVVSDDFTLGSQARRWLDDDEFLVRRRIHREMRAMTGHA